MTPELAARITLWWVRIYTIGLPQAERETRLAEIDSDLAESLAASAGPYEIFSRLARGVGDDLTWSMYQMEHSARTAFIWTIGSLFTVAFLAYWFTYPSESLRIYVINSAWAWVMLKAVHFLAMAIFIGLRVIVDLRLLGQAYKEVAIGIVIRKLALPTIISAAVAIVSGMAFYATDYSRVSGSVLFQTKLLLLALALMNLWYLHVIALRNFDAWEAAHDAPPLTARVSAYLSMGLWSALVFVSMTVPYYFV